MKIALISYEYPPDTAVGGIATYLHHVVRMLAAAGHQAEVFTASSTREGRERETSGVLVHRIQMLTRARFPQLIAPLFAKRHRDVAFDVLEGPDFFGEAYLAAGLCPDLPYVVKLHTPSSFYRALALDRSPMMLSTSAQSNLRMLATVAKRVVWRLAPRVAASAQRRRNPVAELEKRNAERADLVVSPSPSLRSHAATIWGIPSDRLAVVATPFHATDITPAPSHGGPITFVGRLECRKGVFDLADAIVIVQRRAPGLRFRFVGADGPSGDGRRKMRETLERRLAGARHMVEFTGHVSREAVARYVADSDLCVFPSLWENFPMVCLEAMAAGRAIIGSSAGGMQEMLSEDCGVLVPPRRPKLLANAILALMEDPERRTRLGANALHCVRTRYSPDALVSSFEATYRRAIELRQRRLR